MLRIKQKTAPGSRTVPDRVHINMSLQTKEQTGSLSRTKSIQTTNRLPERNGLGPCTQKLGYFETKTRLPEPNDAGP